MTDSIDNLDQVVRVRRGSAGVRAILGGGVILALTALSWQVWSGLESSPPPENATAEQDGGDSACLPVVDRHKTLFPATDGLFAPDIAAALVANDATVVAGRVSEAGYADGRLSVVIDRSSEVAAVESWPVLVLSDPVVDGSVVQGSQFVAVVDRRGPITVVPGGFFFGCGPTEVPTNLAGPLPVTFGPTLAEIEELAWRLARSTQVVRATPFDDDSVVLDIGTGTVGGERLAVILPSSVAVSRSPASPFFNYVSDKWNNGGQIWNLALANELVTVRVGLDSCWPDRSVAIEGRRISVCTDRFQILLDTDVELTSDELAKIDVVVLATGSSTDQGPEVASVFGQGFGTGSVPWSSDGELIYARHGLVRAIDEATLRTTWVADLNGTEDNPEGDRSWVIRAEDDAVVVYTVLPSRGADGFQPAWLTTVEKSGSIRWRRAVTTTSSVGETGEPGRSGPIVLGPRDGWGPTGNDPIMEAFDPATGEPIWSIGWADVTAIPEVTSLSGHAFTQSGDPLLFFLIRNATQTSAVRFDRFTGERTGLISDISTHSIYFQNATIEVWDLVGGDLLVFENPEGTISRRGPDGKALWSLTGPRYVYDATTEILTVNEQTVDLLTGTFDEN